MLDFAKMVTNKGQFTSMAVDFFCSSKHLKNSFLVNELQTIVGFKEVEENEHTGKWSYDETVDKWCFTHGRFHDNACANLRVLTVLKQLGCKVIDQTIDHRV